MSRCGFTESELFDHATGQGLEADRRRAIDEHLAACQTCRDEHERLRLMAADLAALAGATRTDLPEQTAEALLAEGRAMLAERPDEVTYRLGAVRRRARRTSRLRLLQRLLIPAAAAAVLIFGIFLAAEFPGDDGAAGPARAAETLYTRAESASSLADLSALAPLARRALDETLADYTPDVGRVANLQLLHYIAERASEPRQLRDARFLVEQLKEDDRRAGRLGSWEQALWDLLAELEPRAHAAPVPTWLDAVRTLLATQRYEDAYQVLIGNEVGRLHPLAAYVAVQAGRPAEAARLLEAMIELERGDQRLVRLLWAELAMSQQQFDEAMKHYVAAAESDSRFWFQAGYLCKYERGDAIMAGQFFQNTGDEHVAAHIRRCFRSLVAQARQTVELFAQDFDDLPAGSPPPGWKPVPSHTGQYAVARVDGSHVLKLNELGIRDAKLCTGYPGWSNYTLTCDFRYLEPRPESRLELAVYEHGMERYALELRRQAMHLVRGGYGPGRAAAQASVEMSRPVEQSDWLRCRIAVRNLDPGRTRVAASLWPRDATPPATPQINWIDNAGGTRSPLRKGIVAIRVSDGIVVFDNVSVTANDASTASDEP